MSNQLTVGLTNHEFPVSTGAIVFSYTSQIFLPSLEENMTDRSNFRKMLSWSYVSSGFVKVVLSLVCFLTWAGQTKEVVTDNLPPSVRPLINCLLAIKALLSYPLPYFVAMELIEDWICACFGGSSKYLKRSKKSSDEDYETISIRTLKDLECEKPRVGLVDEEHLVLDTEAHAEKRYVEPNNIEDVEKKSKSFDKVSFLEGIQT